MNRWEFFEAQLQKSARAVSAKNFDEAWSALEKAHVLGQAKMIPHLRVHWLMLVLALRTYAPREALGQLLRLSLVIPGTFLKRLPAGNTGRAGVSALQPMEVEEELRRFLR
jgi:hypothetical protein